MKNREACITVSLTHVRENVKFYLQSFLAIQQDGFPWQEQTSYFAAGRQEKDHVTAKAYFKGVTFEFGGPF